MNQGTNFFSPVSSLENRFQILLSISKTECGIITATPQLVFFIFLVNICY